MFVDALRVFRIGASWGSTHSIVTPQLAFRLTAAPGSTPGKFIRFSIGLEPVEDLQADIEAALMGLSAGTMPGAQERAVDQREL